MTAVTAISTYILDNYFHVLKALIHNIWSSPTRRKQEEQLCVQLVIQKRIINTSKNISTIAHAFYVVCLIRTLITICLVFQGLFVFYFKQFMNILCDTKLLFDFLLHFVTRIVRQNQVWINKQQ